MNFSYREMVLGFSLMVILNGCGPDTSSKIYSCDGEGIIKYSNGVYKGECREGYGIYTWNNGDKYDGEWHNNEKNGEGKFITQYGIYKGVWRDGKLIEVTNQDTKEEAYKYFNSIRKQAGMIELEPNGILE